MPGVWDGTTVDVLPCGKLVDKTLPAILVCERFIVDAFDCPIPAVVPTSGMVTDVIPPAWAGLLVDSCDCNILVVAVTLIEPNTSDGTCDSKVVEGNCPSSRVFSLTPGSPLAYTKNVRYETRKQNVCNVYVPSCCLTALQNTAGTV